MRLRYAVGLAVVVLAAAVAAVAWAPAVTAQQGATSAQWRQSGVAAGTGWSVEEPQGTTWVGQGGTAFAFGGPRLGVTVRDIEAAEVGTLKLSGQVGVVVDEVAKDSAAEKAGLKAGDVIVHYDGEPVRSTRQFTRLVTETADGRAVKIGVIRDGKRIDVDATPKQAEGPFTNIAIDRDGIKLEVERNLAQAERGKAQAERNKALAERNVAPLLRQFRMERKPGDTVMAMPELRGDMAFAWDGRLGELLTSRGRLGVTVQELTPELATYFGVKDGVLVSTVRADSPAAKAGIKAGDVITTVNEKAVTDASALVEQLRDKEGDVTIGLSRDKKAMSLKATMQKDAPTKSKIVVKRTPA